MKEQIEHASVDEVIRQWRETSGFKGTAFKIDLPEKLATHFGKPAYVLIRRFTPDEWAIIDKYEDKDSFDSYLKMNKVIVLLDPDNVLVELPGFNGHVAQQGVRISGFTTDDPTVTRLPAA